MTVRPRGHPFCLHSLILREESNAHEGHALHLPQANQAPS